MNIAQSAVGSAVANCAEDIDRSAGGPTPKVLGDARPEDGATELSGVLPTVADELDEQLSSRFASDHDVCLGKVVVSSSAMVSLRMGSRSTVYPKMSHGIPATPALEPSPADLGAK